MSSMHNPKTGGRNTCGFRPMCMHGCGPRESERDDGFVVESFCSACLARRSASTRKAPKP